MGSWSWRLLGKGFGFGDLGSGGRRVLSLGRLRLRFGSKALCLCCSGFVSAVYGFEFGVLYSFEVGPTDA